MTFADWSAEEANHHPVSLPTIVSTTDLFDGELFGDELIDIYNNSVADGSHGKFSTLQVKILRVGFLLINCDRVVSTNRHYPPRSEG